uniref:Xylanolytic transcriptional activator regulatory domain-containing protein n=1 Tax=Kwoniella dejecticola CBS 10117 TaxID=1296121 RepID=A0A1A5ZWL5_9TREE|nr:uncharacterized protein I303_06955 [Kwoniella dejecticola CBS 10117]OBR82196.1 hypothetical protein I303_06955 [Kwoniella dejecticola CBS 10117]
MCPDGQLRPLKGQYLHAAGETEALRNRIAYLEGLLAQAQEQGFDLELTQGRTSRTQAESASMNGLSLSRSKQEGQVGRGHEDEALIDEGRDGEDIEDGQLIVGEDPGSSSFFGNAGAHYHLHLNGDGSQRNPSPSLPDLPAEWLDTFPLPCTAPLSVKNLDAAILNYSVDPDHFWAHLFPRAYPPDDIPLTPALNSHELGLIYLVLATGVAMDLSLPPYNETAETLFKLGRMALSIDPSDSILFVQSIHIMSRYLSNSFRGPKATLGFWSCLGMAVRSAQSMGLHRDGRRWKLPAEEIETRRRVFWEIYTEDVLQSMTQARPRLISLATMDCAVPQCASDQHDVDGRLLFHHYKYRLCKILSKVNDVQVSVDPVPYKEILAIHDGLREFEDELPPILRTDHPKNNVHHSLVWHRLTLRLLNMEG